MRPAAIRGVRRRVARACALLAERADHDAARLLDADLVTPAEEFGAAVADLRAALWSALARVAAPS